MSFLGDQSKKRSTNVSEVFGSRVIAAAVLHFLRDCLGYTVHGCCVPSAGWYQGGSVLGRLIFHFLRDDL